MTAARRVLGWTMDMAAPLPGVDLCPVSSVSVLLLKPEYGSDPRSVLRWQLRLFETGREFLPVAPSSTLHEREGIAFTEAHAVQIAAELAQIAGRAQLTVAMTWQGVDTAPAPASNGQAWLRARRQTKAASDLRRQQAERFLADCTSAGGQVSIRHRQNRVECDLLIPRNGWKAAVSRIKTLAAGATADTGHLTVSGPWPPFSFVQPFWGKTDPVI